MEDLLARYLDGDLDDAGASELLRESRRDPELARELREYEALLEAAERVERPSAPAGLVERVMESLERSDRATAKRVAGNRRTQWLGAAAGLVVGLLIGGASMIRREPAPVLGAGAAPAVAIAGQEEPAGPGVEYYRAVRLVYAPSRPDVKSVAVAGSFNGWDPGSTPMVRRDGTWEIVLVLPPGDHEYMIVEDGERWLTDPLAPRNRQDGFGGVNGLLDVRS